MKKKILALILALSMAVSLVTPAIATGTEGDPTTPDTGMSQPVEGGGTPTTPDTGDDTQGGGDDQTGGDDTTTPGGGDDLAPPATPSTGETGGDEQTGDDQTGGDNQQPPVEPEPDPQPEPCKDCGQTEGHKADCATNCTCGTEVGAHLVDCAIYVCPECERMGEHDDDCVTLCSCKTENDFHAEDCHFYVKPEEPQVYTRNENGYYVLVEDETLDMVDAFNGKTLYLAVSEDFRDLIFSCKENSFFNLFVGKYITMEVVVDEETLEEVQVEAVENQTFVNLALSGAILNEKQASGATLSLSPNTPAETVITLSAWEEDPAAYEGEEPQVADYTVNVEILAEETMECPHCGKFLEEGMTHKADCLSKCTCTPVDDVHQEGCPLWICSACGVMGGQHDDDCATLCICEVFPAEGEKHSDTCPLWACDDCGKNPCDCCATCGKAECICCPDCGQLVCVCEPTLCELILEEETVEAMYLVFLNAMQNSLEDLTALTFEEIIAIQERVNQLDPEGDDIDTAEFLETLTMLPNCACPVCGEPLCTIKHVRCEVCGEYDCKIPHVLCETCGEYDCTKTHEVCEVCGEEECICILEEEGCEPAFCEDCGEVVCICCPYCGGLVTGQHEAGCAYAATIIPGVEFEGESEDRAVNFTDAAAPLDLTPVRPISLLAFMSSKATKTDHDDLITSKVVDYNSETGTGTLTLEAFLEGDPTTKERIPSDIILVVDQSTSMCYCMECGADPDMRSQVDHHRSYFVRNHTYSTKKDQTLADTPIAEVFYCPGTAAAGYGSYTCGHSQGGWFDKVHTSSTTSSTSSRGNRYVPSIDNGKAYKLQSGTNKDYNIYTRVFWKTGVVGEKDSSLLTGRVDILNQTSSALRYNDSTVKLYNTNNKKYSTAPTLYRQSGGKYITLKYCSSHAAWHDENVSCDTTNAADTGVPFYVPTAIIGEVTLGTARIFNNTKCVHTNTRYQALKTALATFTESVYSYSVEHDLSNRMAVAAFGSEKNCMLFSVKGTGTEVAPVALSDLEAADYAKSLHDVSTTNGQTLIDNAIDRIHDQGEGTHTHRGLSMAEGVLENNRALLDGETKRNRIVILFTDGQPQITSTTADPYGGADRALDKAHTLKTGLSNGNATVYTIGIFNGADGSNLNCVEKETVAASDTGYITEKNSSNKLMHLLSSNYMGTEKPTMAKTYRKSDFRTGYYLSADDPDALEEAFYNIAENINQGAAVDMDETTVIKDIVAPCFNVPNDSQVTFHTEVCTGKDSNGNYTFENDNSEASEAIDAKITKKPGTDANTIEVDGFDFNEYFVAIDDEYGTPKPHGRKLVLEIPIKVNVDFLGGDSIFTNEAASGVYTAGGVLIESFDRPTVDIPLKTVEPVVQAKDIYLTQPAKLPTLVDIGSYSVGGTPYEVNGTNNEYVDIVYTITDEKGNEVATCTIDAGTDEPKWSAGADADLKLEKDATYQVQCTVISKNKPAHTQPSEEKQATVRVFKPEITFRDSTIKLGETANYANNFVSAVWKNGNTTAPPSMGTAPELDYTYTPGAAAFKADTPVKVAVKVGDEDITNHVTFYREACSVSGCGHTKKQKVEMDVDNPVNFMVHLSSFILEIVKSGTADANQSYIFEVSGPDDLMMEVVIHGDDTATITNLPIGSYTVSEVNEWSWRYKDQNGKTVATTSATDGVMTVEFVNERENGKWLSGDSWCKNLWNATPIGATGSPTPDVK